MWTDLRFLERAVWVLGMALTAVVAVCDSLETAWAVLFGVALASSNFSASRWILGRLIHRQEQLRYAALYSSKFVLLGTLLAVIAFRTQLSLGGVVIGLSALPLSMVALLIKVARRSRGT